MVDAKPNRLRTAGLVIVFDFVDALGLLAQDKAQRIDRCLSFAIRYYGYWLANRMLRTA